MLNLSTYLIKEHVGLLKLTDRYDIIDPQTGRKIGFAQEKVGAVTQLFRFLVSKQMLPTAIEVREGEGENGPLVFTIKRGFSLFRSRVEVLDAGGQSLGYFKSKILTIGGGFYVFDTRDNQVAEIKGNWVGWDFQLLDKSGKELGKVTKQWAGAAKELFTSADNYVVALNEELKSSPGVATLLLAAGLAIDCIYKEGRG